MWHDICLANREPLLGVLELFGQDLARLTEHIRTGSGEAIMETFQRAKHARDNLYQE